MKGYKDIVKQNDFRHRYLYDENDNKAGVIVLLREFPYGEKRFSIGYSICSKLEPNFNKKLGKAIAILRAKSGKTNLDKIPAKFKDQIEKKLPTMYENY